MAVKPLGPAALVVEDEFVTATDLVRLLGKLGYDATMVPGVEAAREAALTAPPLVALVDINLHGGFEGIDLARQLADQTGAGIVFVTGYSAFDLHLRMRDFGPAIVLFKPLDERSVELAVQAALTRQRRRAVLQ